MQASRRTRWRAQAREVGGEQRQDDGRADPRVDVQLLGRVVGDHGGQEVEDCAPHGVHVAQPRGNGFRAGVDDVQGVEDRQERQDQGGTEQDGQEGTERVGRYSKNASTRAFLPRAFARAAALTSSLEAAVPDFIEGRLLISLKTD